MRRRKATEAKHYVGIQPPEVSASSVSDDESYEAGTAAASKRRGGDRRPWSPVFAFFVRALILVAFIVAAGVSFVLLRAEGERAAIEEAKATQGLYTKDHRVCAGRGADDEVGVAGPFATFPSLDAARADSEGENVVAHCGGCGQCSTVTDMTIMAKTTQTLTDDGTRCSARAMLGSVFLLRGIDVYRSIATECMTKNVGFTPSCQECWTDDMACSIQKCVFTCIKSLYILHEPKNKGADGKLNSCLECDEKVCGPDFLRCSGANRRRQGIHSDIERDDDKELCRSVDVDWRKEGV